MPMVAAAFWVDLVKDALDARSGASQPGNAYRIIARRT